jgi:elongation factor G
LRETLTSTAEGEAVFERRMDGDEIYGRATVRVAPLARGVGFRFTIAPEAASLPFLREEVRHQIADGAREAADSGVLQGFPLQDVEVTLTGATWREGASKPFAYKVATADAVRAAAARASPVLLEPIMKLELSLPNEHIGGVIGALDARKGTILDVAERGAAVKVIQAEAPLRRMFGFATELRSLTQGRALFTMEFDRYDAAG